MSLAPDTTPVAPFAPAGGFVTKAGQVSLKPGQIVHFKPGRGYYAGGAIATPAPSDAGGAASAFAPTMTPEQIAADASGTALGEIKSMIAPVQQTAAAQAATSLAQQRQSAGFNSGADKLLASIGPQIQAGYGQAGKETGQLAQGFTSSVQGQLSDTQRAGAELAAKLGLNAPEQVDPSAFGNALYAQNGFIPGTLLTQQGAHARQEAIGQRVVNKDVGRAEQQGIVADQHAAEAKTATQIATIAAKYPQLFSKQEHEDIAANAKALSTNSTITRDYNTALHQHNQDVLASEKSGFSEDLANAKLKVSIESLNARISYQNGQLKISGRSAEASFIRAQTAANGIDASASKAEGHLVMKNGQNVLTKDGKFVAVDPRIYSKGSTKTPQAIYQSMVKQASSDFRSQENPETVPTGSPASGKYILDPALTPGPDDFVGQPIGTLQVPDSTNDITRAKVGSQVTFAQKRDQYVQQYGVTRAQARKALVAGGWKPDGKRTTIPVMGPTRP